MKKVAFSSTAVSLANATLYPTFNRVVPSDSWQAVNLAELIADFGWSHLSILYTTDDYAVGMTSSFREAAAENGIDIGVVQSFPLVHSRYDPVDLAEEMSELKEAKTNINVLIAGNDASAFVALRAAAEAGIAGTDFVWIGVDAWFGTFFLEGRARRRLARRTHTQQGGRRD